MIKFRSELHDATVLSKQGNTTAYQAKLKDVSANYLTANNVRFEESENTSALFSLALQHYSKRLKTLNPQKQ